VQKGKNLRAVGHTQIANRALNTLISFKTNIRSTAGRVAAYCVAKICVTINELKNRSIPNCEFVTTFYFLFQVHFNNLLETT
jgi:hypothetical protein